MIGSMAVLFFALLAGAAPAQEKINISIGTGGTDGVYYPMGGGLANILSKNIPGMQATAEVTGGSVDNLKLIGGGKSEVGFSMVDATLDAFQGQDKFKDGKIPLRTLMALYPNRMHVVSIESTKIKKMSDLKGKRVSTGPLIAILSRKENHAYANNVESRFEPSRPSIGYLRGNRSSARIPA